MDNKADKLSSMKESSMEDENSQQKESEELSSALDGGDIESEVYLSVNTDSLLNNEEIWQVSVSDEDKRADSSSDIDNEDHVHKLKKKTTQETNEEEKEAEAELQRRKAIQFREEKIALYLLSASPLILYTPIDNQEQKDRDQQQELEKQGIKDQVGEALTLLSVLRCLKPEILGQYIIKLLSPLANLNRILDQNNINLLQPKKMTLRE